MSPGEFLIDESVGAYFKLPWTQVMLTPGRYLKVSLENSEDLDEMTAALTACRDELAQFNTCFQVPLIVQVPDEERHFRTVFHEWKEVSIEEMVRRGWHPSFIKAAGLLA